MVENMVEGTVLLILTALLTGIVAPYILRRIDEQREARQREIDERNERERKIFEAEISRQSKIIDSQALLLEDISQIIWEFQYLMLGITYYATENNQALYMASVQKYEVESWRLLARFRTEISKSRRLVGDKTYEVLLNLLNEILALDRSLSRLTQLSLTKRDVWQEFHAETLQEWSNLHYDIYTHQAERYDEIIKMLANEFRLTNFDIESNKNAEKPR